MIIDNESIKRLLEIASEKGISKPGILKARAKYGAWERVGKYGFKETIRKEDIREIAKLFDIDTAKIIKPKVKVIFKPKPKFPELSYAARRRVKEAIAKTRAVKKFFRLLKKKKADYAQGWYVLYEQEICDQSPPCDPDSPNTHWELRTQKVSWFEKEPNLDFVRDEILERNGFYWRTRNWSLVYFSYEGKTRESKQTR